MFHADRRTEMTKLIVAFRGFAHVPKSAIQYSIQLMGYMLISQLTALVRPNTEFKFHFCLATRDSYSYFCTGFQLIAINTDKCTGLVSARK